MLEVHYCEGHENLFDWIYYRNLSPILMSATVATTSRDLRKVLWQFYSSQIENVTY